MGVDPKLGWYESGYLLLGFSPTEPRTLSGAVYNIGGGLPTARDYRALGALIQAGRVRQAPGCAGGWWLL